MDHSSEIQRNLSLIGQGYLNFVNHDLRKAISKAVAAGTSPPKSKHVRRIVISAIRLPVPTSECLTEALMNSKAWVSNPQIAIKAYYLLLLCSQQESPVQNIKEKRELAELCLGLSGLDTAASPFAIGVHEMAAALQAKMIFHQNHSNVSGDLSKVEGEKPSSDELGFYLNQLVKQSMAMLSVSRRSNYLCLAVCLRPMLNEAIGVANLLLPDRNEKTPIVGDLYRALGLAMSNPFLASSVSFPPKFLEAMSKTP